MNDETQLKEAIDYVEDDSFTFEGYQVVRGEFFSHVFEPSFTFNNYKVQVNTAVLSDYLNLTMFRYWLTRKLKSWRSVLVKKMNETLSAGVLLLPIGHLSKLPAACSLPR